MFEIMSEKSLTISTADKFNSVNLKCKACCYMVQKHL